MIQDTTMRKSILASIIASILVIIFIQPILGLAYTFIIFIGEYVYTGFSNQIYHNAALGERPTTVFMMFVAMLVSINLFFVLLTFLVFLLTRTSKTEASEGSKVDKKESFIHKKRLNSFLKMASVISYGVLLLCSLILLTFEFTNLQLNTSFQQRLTVLAPKLTELENKELQAQWASMNTRADFEAITEQMSRLAKDRNVVLPEPLMK